MASKVRERSKCADSTLHLAMVLSDEKVAVESKAPCFNTGLAAWADSQPFFYGTCQLSTNAFQAVVNTLCESFSCLEAACGNRANSFRRKVTSRLLAAL